MFRLLSKQAVKAIRRPGLILSSSTTSRHVHNMQTPYNGPPSYDTIARRLSSSQVDPQAYINRKHQQEAKERGEYVDIHDIGAVDPRDYDVLISDVDDEKLRGEVAEIVGIQYHAEATKEDANKLRTIFPAVVSDGSRAHWVSFVVDSGSPLTYLSAQTSNHFNITAEEIGPTHIKIAGYHHAVHRSPDHLHFSEVNLLGMDFSNLYNVSQWNDFKKARAKLFFGRDWEVKKSKL